jgi:hypothetical protein
MSCSIAEIEELREMRSNIRRGVNALELCWSCEKLCEGEKVTLDKRVHVWLCQECQQEALTHRHEAQAGR